MAGSRLLQEVSRVSLNRALNLENGGDKRKCKNPEVVKYVYSKTSKKCSVTKIELNGNVGNKV